MAHRRRLAMTHAATIVRRTRTAVVLVALATTGEGFAVERPRFVVQPYLQRTTCDGTHVLWETDRPATTALAWGERVPLDRRVEVPGLRRLHAVRVEGLPPSSRWCYQARSATSAGHEACAPVRLFRTAPREGEPFVLAVVGDTQDQPDVWREVAARVHAERPAALLHVGDVVGVGPDRREWTQEYFAPAADLLAHVPSFPVLGNHEEDSRFFYEYMALPEPEHRYAVRWGDVEVFALDSNRSLARGGEQLAWLDRALAASRTRWRFVTLHHPPFTSDADDYGDARTGPTAEGDPRCRDLVPVLERHDVDLVFFGHIHAYERSWPIRAGRVDERRGVVYVQTGGAGGYLEEAAPQRGWFCAHRRRTHHYLLVGVTPDRVEVRAYDIEGRLFDWFDRRKTP
jgi:hypothetical protein